MKGSFSRLIIFNLIYTSFLSNEVLGEITANFHYRERFSFISTAFSKKINFIHYTMLYEYVIIRPKRRRSQT